MKVNETLKRNIRRWVKQLRSGKFSQTESALNNEDGFCCLGVACKVFIPKDQLKLETREDDEGYEYESEFLFGELPDSQDHAPQWLKEIDDDFQKRTEVSLSGMNDGISIPLVTDDGIVTSECMKFTFDEIADMLELVYLEGVELK